ncbi:MAG: LptF/LptG family permease [Elusimicrobiota bacterium]
MNKLRWYILKNFSGPFLLGLLIFSFLLIFDKIFTLVNLMFAKGVNPVSVGKLFMLLIPTLVPLTFPMSFLVGSLLTFARMAEDNEITAIRASGIKLTGLILPFIILSLFFSSSLVWYNQNILPTAQRYFRILYQNILAEKPYIRIEEGTYLTLNQYKIYVESRDAQNFFHQVLIYKFNDTFSPPVRISAMKGRCYTNFQESLVFELFDGKISQPSKHALTQVVDTKFERYVLVITLSQDIKEYNNASRTIREMTGKELKLEISKIKDNFSATARMAVEYNLRNGIAFACLMFTLTGIPLGIQIRQRNRAIGFAASIIVIAIYYLALIFGITLGDRSILPASIAMWLPNIIVGIIGIFLYYRMSKI